MLEVIETLSFERGAGVFNGKKMSYYLRFLNWPAVGEERVNFVGEAQSYRIFEVPESSATDTAIKIQVKGRTVATSRFFAIDRDGVAYIIDNDKKQLLGSMGQCEILEID